MRAGGVIGLIYFVVGVLVAAMNGYFQNLGNITNILELIVAIVAWPLVLAGIEINFAAEGNGGGGGGGS